VCLAVVIQKVVESLPTKRFVLNRAIICGSFVIQQSTVVMRWAGHIAHIREVMNSDILGNKSLERREHLLDPSIDGRPCHSSNV
jgi:hypothetical protein